MIGFLILMVLALSLASSTRQGRAAMALRLQQYNAVGWILAAILWGLLIGGSIKPP